MKLLYKLAIALSAIFLFVPALALAQYHGHQSQGGRGNNHGGNNPPPVVTPPPPAAGETRLIAYTTGYGWPDNTPPGGAISNPILHTTDGGVGSYADPITLAVGHSISGGKDTLDYPAGTKFYIPDLRKYFIVEDTCGDGNTPQNGPCHTGYQGHPWIDLWVGGTSAQKSATLACEDSITDLHLVIENPSPNYSVVSGPVFNGACSQQFGDTVI